MKMRKFNVPFIVWDREAEDEPQPIEVVNASEIELEPQPGIEGGPRHPNSLD